MPTVPPPAVDIHMQSFCCQQQPLLARSHGRSSLTVQSLTMLHPPVCLGSVRKCPQASFIQSPNAFVGTLSVTLGRYSIIITVFVIAGLLFAVISLMLTKRASILSFQQTLNYLITFLLSWTANGITVLAMGIIRCRGWAASDTSASASQRTCHGPLRSTPW